MATPPLPAIGAPSSMSVATPGAGRGQPTKKKKPKLSLQEQMLRDAMRADKERQSAETKQNAADVYTAQRMSELTDGSSRSISSSGVRQRGTSDAKAGKIIREELASGAGGNKGPSTATTPGGVDPYKPTGFQGTGMNGKPGYQLRTEAERQARIAESPLSAKTGLVSSKRETGEMFAGGRDGNFSAAQSAKYREYALSRGASATMHGQAKPLVKPLTAAPGQATQMQTAMPGPKIAPNQAALDAATKANQISQARRPSKPMGTAEAKASIQVGAKPLTIPQPDLTKSPLSPTQPAKTDASVVMKDTTRLMPSAPPKVASQPMFSNTSKALGLGRTGIQTGVNAAADVATSQINTAERIGNGVRNFITAPANKTAEVISAIRMDMAGPASVAMRDKTKRLPGAKQKPQWNVRTPSGTAAARG